MRNCCRAIGFSFGLCLVFSQGIHAQGIPSSPRQPALIESKQKHPVIALEQAYDMALESDQSIRIAYWEVRKANLLPWNALARTMGLQIDANGNLGRNESSTRLDTISGVRTRTNVRTESGRIGLSVSQPLIDATVFPSYKLGKLSTRTTRLQHQFTVRGILFGVAKAYYDVLNQQRIVEVNRQAVQLNETQVDYALKRKEVGEVTRTDELRARVALESSRRTLIESENQLLNFRNLLANILGLPDDRFQLIEPGDYPPNSEPFEQLIATAFEKREDLQVADLAIEQDKQRHRAVLARYWPSLAAQWNGGLAESQSAFDRSANDWAATLSVQVPIFDGGQREVDLITTREQVLQTRLRKDLLARQIQEDTKAAWLTTRSLSKTLQALKLQVEAADQSYKDLDNQYRAGTATSLDVLSALNELNASRRDLTVQTYAYQVALRNLEQVAGVFQQQRVEKVKIR